MKQIDSLLQAINEYSYEHSELTVQMTDLLLLREEIKGLREALSSSKHDKVILQAKINMYELDIPVKLDYKV